MVKKRKWRKIAKNEKSQLEKNRDYFQGIIKQLIANFTREIIKTRKKYIKIFKVLKENSC